jgi:hypothetical protein
MVARVLLILLLLVIPARAQVDQGMFTAPSINSIAPSGFNKISNIFTVDFAKDFGVVITLTGLSGTATVSGLQTTDSVMVYCISAIPNGVSIANARVSAADTLEVKFATAVLGNVVLGSLNYRIVVFRP